MRYDLIGEWEFQPVGNNGWLKATVPGCNYIDLMNNNIIQDPFYGTNEKDCGWVAEKDWVYTRKFDVTADMLECDRVWLHFDMLDTVASVNINGKQVAKVHNCHMTYDFDIKEVLVEGENEITIYFTSPVNYVNGLQAKEHCPANANGLNGIPHIRKPQCHFGWDWGPVLTPSGISGDVYLETSNVARIQDIYAVQEHSDGKVTLNITADIDNYRGEELTCLVSVTSPSGEALTSEVNAMDKLNATIVVDSPELWSIRELNDREKQPLYELKVQVMSEGESVATLSKKIGLRTIQLEQPVDEYGKNFRFVLNGTPIFAKGANWIPADSFITRANRAKLEYYIKSAADCHFNMIRVWGGGYYESEDFYDLCDEYGILVWQDFAFACQPYPFFMDGYTDMIKQEVENVVKRIRTHASLALWCGNNEIELMSIAWITRKNYVQWTEKFYWNILPEWLKQLDNVTSYIPGTPVGIAHNKGFGNDNVGDTHLWAVWHGLQPMTYYRKRMTRFCSEFGFESLPDLKTIRRYAEEKDYSLTSEVFRSHQKCASGNMKMAFYIASRFRLPKKFENYIYLSQICQQECIRDATEHWRRNKGRCNGSLFWQYNDCWPVCSWASVDYYGNYKALQYTSKHFFAPLMLSFEDTKKKVDLYAINDKLSEYDIEAKLRLMTFDGEEKWAKSVKSHIGANSSAMVYSISTKELKEIADIKTCVLVADMYVDGEYVSRKTLLFDKEKKLALPKANINVECRVEDGKAIYTLTSDKFARLVQVYSNSNTQPFSDNFFDILPNESVEITQELCEIKDVEELIGDIILTSVSDVEAKSSSFSDTMFRGKVFLTPINFANWIYYMKIPSKIKVKEDKE